uniref:Uncharacterized protein n=1 Tax=Amphimedon queenslandica TaxID=400682 RepID=A0A1X7TX38_AMPQE
MKDGELVQEHIKFMTELFNGLAVLGDAIYEKHKAIYLLESYQNPTTLLTALEANETVPKMKIVMNRILHTERKQADNDKEKAFYSKHHSKHKGPRCHYCKRLKHSTELS